MSTTSIRAGRAFVELYLKDGQLIAGLNATKAKLQAWAASLQAIGTKLSLLGAAAMTPLVAAIKATGNLAETTSKFGAVFGEQAPAVREWAETFRKAVGRSQIETMDSLSAFQSFFTGLGIGRDKSAEMSKEITALAVDFASFHNIASDTEGMERFISALSGSSEVVDRFGINLKQAAIDQKLLEMGFPKIAQGATETQKVLARMAIIRESMGRQGAIGDALRTANSFNNTLKRLKSNLFDMAVAIGEAVMPYATAFLAVVNVLTKGITSLAKEFPFLVTIVLAGASALIIAGAASLALSFMMQGAMFAINGFMMAWALMKAVVVGTVAIFSAVGSMIAAISAPVWIVIGALTAAGGAFVYFSGLGSSVATSVSRAFDGAGAEITQSLSAMSSALASGNFALAGKIGIALLKLEFQRGIAAIFNIWTSLKATLLNVWTEFSYGATSLWIRGSSALASAFESTKEGLSVIWNTLCSTLTQTWHTSIGFIKKAWTKLKGMFDSSVNVEAEVERINKETNDKNTAVQKESDAAIVKRAKERDQKLSQIDKEKKSMLDALDPAKQADKDKIKKDAEAAYQAEDDAIAKMRKELAQTLEDGAKETKKDSPYTQPGPTDFGIDTNPAAAVSSAQSDVKALGSFSTAVLGRLGPADTGQKQVQLLKQIADNTKPGEDNQPEFGN
jgi:hypothetical protein